MRAMWVQAIQAGRDFLGSVLVSFGIVVLSGCGQPVVTDLAATDQQVKAINIKDLGSLAEDALNELLNPNNPSLSISAPVRGSELKISMSKRNAGSIDSLTWKGRQFIDADDRGRELQSALAFNELGECLNPTEAGGSYDSGSTTTSRILSWSNSGNVLRASTQMAYCLSPGHNYKKPCSPTTSVSVAQNKSKLSNEILNKAVQIGYAGLDNVIAMDIEFVIRDSYQSASFETITGYMPADFSKFESLDVLSGKLSDLPTLVATTPFDLPIFSTPDGAYAMGAYCPDLFDSRYAGAGYVAFDFSPDVVKWSCAFARPSALGVPAGSYKFKAYIVVGTKEDVRQSLLAMYAKDPGASEIQRARLDSSVFDISTYAALNPDLSSFSPARLRAHWLQAGSMEGRQASAEFNVREYLELNRDLAAALGQDFRAAIDHYVRSGEGEGRSSSFYFNPKVFNLSFYRSRYADLRSLGDEELRRHWIASGIMEGRQASAGFNSASYLARYPDLQSAFGTNLKEAVKHYLQYGLNEGRNGAP